MKGWQINIISVTVFTLSDTRFEKLIIKLITDVLRKEKFRNSTNFELLQISDISVRRVLKLKNIYNN